MSEVKVDVRGDIRVKVFIDGQNLYKALNRRHNVRLHPILLARALAGPDRRLVGAHYYSGIHDPDVNQTMYNLVNRRHDLIRRTGVAVTERTLRYLWEWRVEHDDVPPPWYDDAPKRAEAHVYKHLTAREKGIDVALALDAVASALTDECDVVTIVSRDRDLVEVADEIRARCRAQGRESSVRVEVAYVSERRGDEPELSLKGYDAYTEIDDAMIAACRDDFDYGHKLDRSEVDQFLSRVAAAP